MGLALQQIQWLWKLCILHRSCESLQLKGWWGSGAAQLQHAGPPVIRVSMAHLIDLSRSSDLLALPQRI